MDRGSFQGQMRRLVGTFGERNYPQERVEIIWKAFQHATDREFEDVVTECVANHRHAPVVQDLSDVYTEVRKRHAEAARLDSEKTVGTGGALGVLSYAGRAAENKEFTGACMKLIADWTSRKITFPQFLEGCKYLDDCAERIMERPACRKCSGYGVTFFVRDGYSFAARCDCPAGDRQPSEFPLREERIPFPKLRLVFSKGERE